MEHTPCCFFFLQYIIFHYCFQFGHHNAGTLGVQHCCISYIIFIIIFSFLLGYWVLFSDVHHISFLLLFSVSPSPCWDIGCSSVLHITYYFLLLFSISPSPCWGTGCCSVMYIIYYFYYYFQFHHSPCWGTGCCSVMYIIYYFCYYFQFHHHHAGTLGIRQCCTSFIILIINFSFQFHHHYAGALGVVQYCTSYIIFNIIFSFTITMLGHWVFGSVACPLVKFMQVTSVAVSIYTNVAIGIDR